MLHGVVVPLPLVVHGRLGLGAPHRALGAECHIHGLSPLPAGLVDPCSRAAQDLRDLLEGGIDKRLPLGLLCPVPQEHGELSPLLIGEVPYGLLGVVLHLYTCFKFSTCVFNVLYNFRNLESSDQQMRGIIGLNGVHQASFAWPLKLPHELFPPSVSTADHLVVY